MRIVDLGWVNMSSYNFFGNGPKFTHFLLNAGERVNDNAVFNLSIAPPVPEKFAVKFESCLNSRRTLDVFALGVMEFGL